MKIYYLLVALVCTGLWLFLMQDRVSTRIRDSKWWPLGWLATIFLGAYGVQAWFAFFL